MQTKQVGHDRCGQVGGKADQGGSAPAFMGRMMAVFNPINMGASTISVVVAGWLASTTLHNFHATIAGVYIGPIDTIFTASAVLIVAAGTYAYFALPISSPQSGSSELDPPAVHQVVPFEAINALQPDTDEA